MKILVVTLILALAGCAGSSGQPDSGATKIAYYADLVVYTDPANGCQYFSRITKGGLTPRLNPDGTQHCIAKAKP